MQTWRRKLRIQELANIAIEKLESGTEIPEVYDVLDGIMVSQWKSIPTRKQYLISVTKVLTNQNVL